MGQKVNPTCLRLHPENRHFDSCWFNEKQYADSIQKDFHIEIYYNAILKQIQYPSASFFFESSPRKCGVSVLFLNPSQFREQIFKQFGHVEGRNRRILHGKHGANKQNTLFFAKKKTTSLCGLPEKKEELLGLLPPYFFTAPFLQNLKKKQVVFSKEKTHPFLQERKKSENQNLIFSKSQGVCCVLQGKKQTQSEKHRKESHPSMLCMEHISSMQSMERASLLANIVERGVEVTDRRTNLRFKKNLCFSALALTISRYFTQKNLSGNLLSATSRFLLLQPFFYFLKKGKTLSSMQSMERTFSQSEKHIKHKVKNNPINRLSGRFLEKENQTPLQTSHLSRQTNAKKPLFSNLQKSSIYTYHIESIISSRLRSSCKIFLFRAQNVAQNALFIAEEIVYQLQRRNTFRQIQTKFLQELGNKSTIKGVRVTCVGRIGGRAKKAQRARGESFKTGQTSLHLFDSKVSFASKTALTPYGAVGVKVWVCWK